MHPDEQIAMLQAQKEKERERERTKAGSKGADGNGHGDDRDGEADETAVEKGGLGEVRSEREWVLPSQLRERWSLRRFGEVFDAIGLVPDVRESDEGEGEEGEEQEEDGDDANADGTSAEQDQPNPWRTTKRLVLATVDDDSTIVYYIVHDGIVKPRQN